MKVGFYFLVLLALIGSTSCASYDEIRNIETSLTESVDRFHEQLNNEQFHEIYSQATDSLRKQIDETEFTSRLKGAHEQLGAISGKAMVLLTDREVNRLHWAKILGREQTYTHVEIPKSD